MRLVLHIGTHKTGTSSIQNFLASNRGILDARAVHYPSSPHSARNVNFLAAHIAAGRMDAAAAFLAAARRAADRRGAQVLLLSAESFYAMTGFFHNLLGRPVHDYWEHERARIAAATDLFSAAGIEEAPRVVCYLRRQDRFVESIYGQFVKQTPGYSDDIDTFEREAGPIDDYAGHLDLWAERVGVERVRVRRFDDAAPGLVEDFLATALDIDDAGEFEPARKPVNESLDAETLAFKRVLNRLPATAAEGYVVSRIVAGLARRQDQRGGGASLMGAAQREAIIERNAAGNRRLAAEYLGEADTDLFADPGPAPARVAQLSPERGMELLVRYRREMARPGVRAELLARRTVRAVLDRAPVLESLLGGVRRLHNRRRLRLEREGRA